jgi:sugar lactone lactonase YvrE
LNTSVKILLLATALVASNFSLAQQTAAGATMPDNVPALLVKAKSAYTAKDYLTYRKTLERIRQMRPNNSEYMYQLVLAHALLNEKTPAYNLMLSMQQQGLSYDFNLTDDSKNIRNTEVYDYVNDLMIKAGDPVGEAESVFTLPGTVVKPESIAWDEDRKQFLIGTVKEGSVIAVDQDGQMTELLKATEENGMWAVYGLLVDQARNRLWISSASTTAFSGFDPVNKGRSGLFEFDLKTLELIHQYPVPVDGRSHIPGSMVLSPNGDIYVVDRALPVIYRKAAGENRLKVFLATRDMVSMRGITMQPDGRMMYVADREMGIMVIDIEGQKAGGLMHPETLNIGGIDGLYLWENHLIVIQNGIKPQRVMRLALDSGGTNVTAVAPLAIAQPEFDYPNYGVLKANELYFFANSQSASANGSAKPVSVLRTVVDSNADLVKPELQDFINKNSELMKSSSEKSDESN